MCYVISHSDYSYGNPEEISHALNFDLIFYVHEQNNCNVLFKAELVIFTEIFLIKHLLIINTNSVWEKNCIV